QVVVEDPEGKTTGEALLDIANDWAMMGEVVFATPNFVSQYRRHGPIKVIPQQWHLDNTGKVAGQLKGEDVRALHAWQQNRGKNGIVVAVLDDGVDVDHPNLSGRILKHPGDNAKDKLGRDFFLPDDDPD